MFMPYLRESYEDLERAAAGADLLVNHPLVFVGPLLAEKHGLPWASTVLAPLSLFSAADPPVLPGAPWLRSIRVLGTGAYKFVFRIPRLMMRRWEAPLYRLRGDLGLPTPGPVAQMEGQYSPALNLALFSGTFAGRQSDWPPNTVLCGFPRYDGAPPDAATQAALDAFLASGEPPLVFALGSSAVLVADDFWRHAIEAARRLDQRALLITGAPGSSARCRPRGVFRYACSAAFPHASAIVHSGGIGTLAQALAAGRRSSSSVAFDQPDARGTPSPSGPPTAFRSEATGDVARELSPLLSQPGYARGGLARVIGAEEQARPAMPCSTGSTAPDDSLF
jgi:UDP:flavonoid glycosyltransferase YjiC (YdhE family)